jgi:N-acetylglucosaminyl-diphospho-decaprenol L-rhamnosyltransferase
LSSAPDDAFAERATPPSPSRVSDERGRSPNHARQSPASATPATQTKVDVVIPTRNTRDVTLACLQSVLAGGDDRVRLACTIVDNGSTDGTEAAVRSLGGQVEVVRNEDNVGFARACNQGARRGSGEYILFLNSDVFVRPRAIARLASFLDSHPSHVAAAGKLVDVGTDDAQVGFAIRSYPTLARQLALMIGLEKHWPTNPISRKQLMLDFDYSRTQDVEGQPAGACLFVRRTALEAVGGFDEGFFFWFEDVDLVRRLRAHGRVAYVHDAVFEHAGGGTFSHWQRPEIVRTRYESLFRYFRKHHRRTEVAALALAAGALAAVRAIPLTLYDRSRARAYYDVVGAALRATVARRM